MIQTCAISIVIGTLVWPPTPPVIGGIASWYDDGPGLYAAAGPSLRVGNWRDRRVDVCTSERCVRVHLVDWCQCFEGTNRERLIDLSKEAFARLTSLSKGLVEVSIRQPR